MALNYHDTVMGIVIIFLHRRYLSPKKLKWKHNIMDQKWTESIPTHSCLIAFHYCSWCSVPPPDQYFCVLHTCTHSLCSLQGSETGRNRKFGPSWWIWCWAVWSGKTSQMQRGVPFSTVEELEEVPAGNCCLESQNSTVACGLIPDPWHRKERHETGWHMTHEEKQKMQKIEQRNRSLKDWKDWERATSFHHPQLT